MAPADRPRLAAKVRLRADPRGDAHLLLWPEHGLALNATALDVVRLCDGARSVDAIVATLACRHPADARAAIARDVVAFLDRLAARGLLVTAP
ncbi:MAG TPA: pyrroloquinoline quinone biosynthesis peptide chaperone PqqD [Candidatus Binatia bacterium]|nr:pyrroloquinoline quinone biosynthesis peptide chaperone PqqD [Candidatus Binatia bacterium]